MTTASEMQAAADKVVANFDRINQFVNGDAATLVNTDNGQVPSIAKIASDFGDLDEARDEAVAAAATATTKAGEAAASAASAATAAAFNVPWLGITPDPDNTGAYLVPAFEFWPTEERVWRDGALRTMSDLTDHGDGSFTLGTIPAGFSAGSTAIIEFEHTLGDAVSGRMYSQAANTSSLAGGYDVEPRLSSGLAFAGARITNRAAANATADLHQFGMNRLVFAVPASGTALYQIDDGIAVTGPSSATYATPIRICIGRLANNTSVLSGVTIKRVILFAGALTAAQIQAALDATDPNPIPEAPLTVPKWVPEIVADNGTILRPLMHPDWSRGLCWFENDVHDITDILELRGTAPNQQWAAIRPPRGLRHTAGWAVTTDVDLPAAWQVAPNNPTGQIFQSFNPALSSPTGSASRFQWKAGTTGGFPVFQYTVSYTGTTVGNISGGATPGTVPALDGEYLNGIHRIGVNMPPTGSQAHTGVDARPIGTAPGTSALNAATQRPAYFGWGGFFNGSTYSLPMTNISLVCATIWPRALSAAEFRRAMLWNEHNVKPIWTHGDSYGNLGWIRDSILLHAKQAGFKYLPTFRTSRGSQGLTYHNEYLAAWITAYPELADSILVLAEGGLDIGNQNNLAGAAQNPLSIRDAIGLLNTILGRHPDNLAVILEPQTNLASISGLVKETGTAQAGASGSITLAAGATSTSITSQAVRITGGTGAGQTRFVSAYNTTTKVATVSPNWTTTPDATSQYRVLSTLEYQNEFVDAIKGSFADSFAPTNRLMQSQYATAEDYDSAVISGATPSALRSDDIHVTFGTWTPSDSGHYWLGLAAYRRLRDLGLRL